MKIKQIFPVVALAILVFAGVASAQQPTEPRTTVVPTQLGTINTPTVNLSDVAKEVVPEVVPGAKRHTPSILILEVNPSSISGKRLILPPSDGARIKHICIGKWTNATGECKGIYITF